MASEREYERITKQIHSDARQALNDRPYWNTRPAPAATDTGLETVTYRGKFKAEGQRHWEYYPTPDSGFDPDKYEEQALCVRSQAESEIRKVRKDAEELLAAERAEHDNTIATLTSLITDNAAKDARIKALDGECNELVAKCNEIIGQRDHALNTCAQMEEDKDALEAKLAAAEQALDGIDWRSMFLNIHRRMKDGGESNAMAARWLSEEASKAVRAVLGGSDE